MPKPTTYRIRIRTRSPVWTGGVNGKTECLKETSILGGLRFWTEALVRSWGGSACLVTDRQNSDSFDPENPDDVCDVCMFFGCTGRGRSFRLKIAPNHKFPGVLQEDKIGKIGLPDFKHGTKIPTWWLNDPGLAGEFSLEFIPLRPLGVTPELALATVLFLNWGTIGARDQYGHGMIEAQIPEDFTETAQNALDRRLNENPTGPISLRDFFFFKTAVPERIDKRTSNKELPFKIRYETRGSLRGQGEKELRHYFCGSMFGKSMATKYNIGWTRDRGIVGWGFFPSGNHSFAAHRDRCLGNLRDTLAEFLGEQQVVWREFASERDTAGRIADWGDFLNRLFRGDWQ